LVDRFLEGGHGSGSEWRDCEPSFVTQLDSWRDRKRIPQIKAGDVLEVVLVSGDQRDVIFQGGGGDDRITQLHLLLLAQFDRPLDHPIIQRIGRAGADKVEKRRFFLRRNASKTERLDPRHACNRRIRMSRPRSEPVAVGLARMDDDVRIQKHDFNRDPATGGPPAFQAATLAGR